MLSFFYDPEKVTTIWTMQYSDLDSGVLQWLTKILHILNFYIELYKTANKILRNNVFTNNNLQIVLNSQMRLIIKTRADQYCKNFPTSNKVTAIIIDKSGNLCKQDIVLTELVNKVIETSIKWIS